MTRLPLSIAADHPAFAGHFPGRAVVPGVVLLDESLRAIAAHRAARVPADDRPHCRIGAAKFLSFVLPGEPVRLEIDEAADGYRLRIFAGASGDERLALNGNVSFEPSEAARNPAGDA